MQFEGNIFFKIAQKVTKLSYFYQILEYQETRFQFKPFKIEKLLPEKAMQTYRRIQKKYETCKDFTVQPEMWYQSEKRLFAWFVAFYTYLHPDQNGIKTDIDFETLSPVFFHKNVNFLQFHFLILLKTSDKVYWDEEKDQMLLDAINIFGMKWNEVSKSMFMNTNKAVFRSPKNCRERWLNHLDYTKVRGNWTDEEDIVIFEYVVESGGKKWSKLVNVLDDKRTEHTIKNRFNAMIAKYRRYKLEKDIKVAERVLKMLRRKLGREVELPLPEGNNEENYPLQSQSERNFEVSGNPKVDDGQENSNEEEEFENSPCLEYKEEHISQALPLIEQNEQPQSALGQQQANVIIDCIKEQNSPSHEAPVLLSRRQSQMPEHPSIREEGGENRYPFENYSYEMQMYNNYSSQIYEYHKNQLMFYQQLYSLPPAPTADTSRTNRESKLMEDRRRKREQKKEPEHS